mmetsp:Transcript_17815/g.39051  ORF Transcript_17815/g.39051 Transcript_17815/m.39051 type:complete len:285 (-) Transcript_17815:157-1011(-)
MSLLRAGFALAAMTKALGDVDIPSLEIAKGIHMPVLSIGVGGLERSSAKQIASNWLSLGGRGIDTALIYRNADAVKSAIEESKIPREELFITTKVPGCLAVKASVDTILHQLGIDYADLLLIHFPMGDCVAAWKVLEDYHARGILKAIGVSNFKEENLRPLLASAEVVPAVNQIELNVLNPQVDTVALCRSLNITVEAFSPVGRGGVSGNISGNAAVQAIAAAHSVSTYQVALKWILQHGHVITFQSSSLKHQAEDAAIFNFSLSSAEMSTLDGLGISSSLISV